MLNRKQLVIDRSKWRCGYYEPHDTDGPNRSANGIGCTRLLNDQGFQCCLGFAVEQLDGVPHDKLLYLAVPEGPLVGADSIAFAVRYQAVNINDEWKQSFEEREQKIAALFAEHGVEVVFTGKYQNAAQPA